MKQVFSVNLKYFLILTIAILLGGFVNVDGADRYSVVSGNWNATTTWSATSGGTAGASVPGVGDNVFVNHEVKIFSGTEAIANNLTINATGKLVVVGKLTLSGNLFMDFNGNDESELVLLDGCQVIVNGNVLLSNKVSLNISSYFIVKGNFLKDGSANQINLTITQAHIYILGTVSWVDGFSTCEDAYGGTTGQIGDSCDYGNIDDLIINNVGSIDPEIAAIIQSKTTSVSNLSAGSTSICLGGSTTLTIDTTSSIDLLKWQMGTEIFNVLDPPTRPYTYSVTQAGYYYANYKIGTQWYQTNTIPITIVNAPTPSFTFPIGADACALDNVIYTTQSGKSNYVWSVPGILGTDYTIINGGVGTSNYTVTLKWLTAGSKTVSVNYTDLNGCTGTSVSSITTVYPLPTPGLIVPD